MFCYKCGAQLNDGAKFCYNCGANMVQQGDSQPQTEKPQNNTPEKKDSYELDVGIPADIAERANAGDSNASLRIARAYDKGFWVLPDYAKAYYWYYKAYKQNPENQEALFGIAYAMMFGLGVGRDESNAYSIFNRLAGMGNAKAIFELALIHGEGIEVEGAYKDIDKAIEYCEQAVRLGYEPAADTLVSFYDERYIQQDATERCIKFLDDEFRRGNMSVASMLFHIFTDEEIAPKDVNRALNYLDTAAGANYPHAVATLASVYSQGSGGELRPVDEQKSNYYWQRAAQLNDPWALYVMGSRYNNGYGVDVNKELAIECFYKCLEFSYIDSQWIGEAYESIAFILLNDKSKPENEDTGIEYAVLAADEGKSIAQWYVGTLCELGHKLPQDYKMAYDCYEASCEGGNSKGFLKLGNLLLKGGGEILPDRDRAIELLRKAMEMGETEAKDILIREGVIPAETGLEPSKPKKKKVKRDNSDYEPNMDLGVARRLLIFTAIFLVAGIVLGIMATGNFIGLIIGYFIAALPLSIIRLRGIRANEKEAGGRNVPGSLPGIIGYYIARWLVNYVIAAVCLIYWIIRAIVNIAKSK